MPAIIDTPIDPSALKVIEEVEGRDKIANELSERFKAWEEVLDSHDRRWKSIEKLLVNEPERPPDAFWTGFVYRHIPLLSAKARAWQAYVSSAPCQSNPYLVGTLFGASSARASEVEQDFYLFMKKGRWDRVFKMAVLNIGIYGKVYWRVFPKIVRDKPVFSFECFTPRNSFVYPDDERPISEKLNIGHSYDVRVSEIWQKQDEGMFYNDRKPTGSSEKMTRKEAPGLSDPSQPIIKEDENMPKRIVECFDYRDYGLGEKWYRVRFCPDGDPMLLGVYEHYFPVPWYFSMWVHEEQGRELPETSRFNDVQDLQLGMNEMWNLASAGQQMQANPTTFASGWSLPQKYARTKPGDVVPLMQGGQISNLQSKSDLAAFFPLMETIDQKADSMMRLGQQSQGAESTSDNTATAANLRKLATDTAVNDDLANMDICMGEIGNYMQMCYLYYFQEFKGAYGESLSTQSDQILIEEIMWEMNGKTPANTPQAQAEASVALAATLGTFTPELNMALMDNGVNPDEVVKAVVLNSILENKQRILMTKEERTAYQQRKLIAEQNAALAAAASGASGGAGMGMGAGGSPPAGAGGPSGIGGA